MEEQMSTLIKETLEEAISYCRGDHPEKIDYCIREARTEAAMYNASDISMQIERAYETMLPMLLERFNEACTYLDRKEFDRYKQALQDYVKHTQADLTDLVTGKIDGFINDAKKLPLTERKQRIYLAGFAEGCAELVPGMDISRRVRALYK